MSERIYVNGDELESTARQLDLAVENLQGIMRNIASEMNSVSEVWCDLAAYHYLRDVENFNNEVLPQVSSLFDCMAALLRTAVQTYREADDSIK